MAIGYAGSGGFGSDSARDRRRGNPGDVAPADR
jgi:hypothetical protein